MASRTRPAADRVRTMTASTSSIRPGGGPPRISSTRPAKPVCALSAREAEPPNGFCRGSKTPATAGTLMQALSGTRTLDPSLPFKSPKRNRRVDAAPRIHERPASPQSDVESQTPTRGLRGTSRCAMGVRSGWSGSISARPRSPSANPSHVDRLGRLSHESPRSPTSLRSTFRHPQARNPASRGTRRRDRQSARAAPPRPSAADRVRIRVRPHPALPRPHRPRRGSS